MKHLAKYMHDVVNHATETWCEQGNPLRDATPDIDKADCVACLSQVMSYAAVVQARIRQLSKDSQP